MGAIEGYHAHVYFDAADRERAQALCEAAGRTLGVTVGRMHDKPVGPPPAAAASSHSDPTSSQPSSPGWSSTAMG